jgi:hypothetical protein
MSAPIVQPKNFQLSHVSLTDLKPYGKGKISYLNYGNPGERGTSLAIQTPSLRTPFGLNVFEGDNGAKYSFNLRIRGGDTNPKIKAFESLLTTLDKFMVDHAVKNSKAWFGKDKSRDALMETYVPCLKVSQKTDKEGNSYAPTMKINIKRKKDDSDFDCLFYGAESKSDPSVAPIRDTPIEDLLRKGAEMTSIIECTGVWFAGGKFGLGWKAKQVRLDSVPAGGASSSGYGFQNDDEDGGEFVEPSEFSAPARTQQAVVESDDEEEEAPAPAPAPASSKPAPVQAQAVVESDDEEVAPAPVPVKKATTTITKKKVATSVKK